MNTLISQKIDLEVIPIQYVHNTYEFKIILKFKRYIYRYKKADQ